MRESVVTDFHACCLVGLKFLKKSNLAQLNYSIIYEIESFCLLLVSNVFSQLLK